MNNEIVAGIVTIFTAIIGVAIIAALVSNKAQTSSVISAAGNAFSGSLGTALGPITGYTPTSTNGLGFGGASDLTYQ